MIRFEQVGLTVGGIEVSGNNYQRQYFGDQVVFGPAQPNGWGTVDGMFVTDAFQKVHPVKFDSVETDPGTTLTVDLDLVIT